MGFRRPKRRFADRNVLQAKDVSGIMNPNIHAGEIRSGRHLSGYDPNISNTAGRRRWTPEPDMPYKQYVPSTTGGGPSTTGGGITSSDRQPGLFGRKNNRLNYTPPKYFSDPGMGVAPPDFDPDPEMGVTPDLYFSDPGMGKNPEIPNPFFDYGMEREINQNQYLADEFQTPEQEFFDTYGVPMRGNKEVNSIARPGEKFYGLGDRLTRDQMLDTNNLRNFELGEPPNIKDEGGIPIGYELDSNELPDFELDNYVQPFDGTPTTPGMLDDNERLTKYMDKWNTTQSPRQPGLDYVPPRKRWDNPLGDFFRKLIGQNTEGVGSLTELANNNPVESNWRILQGMSPEQQEGYQTAELTQDQQNYMGNPINSPDFGKSKQVIFDQVKDMEREGFLGFGGQEPTTQEEFDDYYNKLQAGEVGNWIT